jgi:two-component system chemotaxis response regulator CheB
VKGRVIAIGASADGIEAIAKLLSGLPRDFPAPVFVAQHVGRTSSGYLPTILGRTASLPVMNAAEGQRIEAGNVYVAPPNQHMLVRGEALHLSSGPEENYCRPAVDVLFRSVAAAFGPAVVGVVPTGYLDDGIVGMLAIHDRGGVTILQDPDEAGAPSMVKSVLARMNVDHIKRVRDIAPLLVELAADAPGEPRDCALELEDCIAGAEATRTELARVLGECAGRQCPMCGDALYALDEPRVHRFRCTRGHAFTEFSVDSSNTGADSVR